MLCLSRARLPGPGSSALGISIEFLNLGGWLSNGDWFQVGKEGLLPNFAVLAFRLFGAPACQDTILGGHAGVGVGVVSLHGAPLTLPSFATPSFHFVFRPDSAVRVVLPLGEERRRVVLPISVLHVGTKGLMGSRETYSDRQASRCFSLRSACLLCCSAGGTCGRSEC